MKRSATFVMTLVLAACAVGAHAAGPLPQVAVTTCGQIVPKKTLGYLTGDLDCTGYDGGDPAILEDVDVAVTLGQKAKLDLRGFTLTASRWGVGCRNIVADSKRHGTCEIFNGSIVGAGYAAIFVRSAYVHDVTVSGNLYGIYGGDGRSRIENAVVSNNGKDGISAATLKARGVTATNNGENGISANMAKVADSTVTGNGTSSFCTTNPGECFDVKSYRRPKVKNVVCGTSGGFTDEAPPTWGVCSSD